MTMFCANHATTAAAADAACCAARTFSHNIALILDAALLASIFVACALLGSGIISMIVISIISIIAIITVMIIVLPVITSSRYGEPT